MDSWGGLQAFLQDFASQRPGPVPRSLLHCALLKLATSGGLQYGPSRGMLLSAAGLPPYINSYPEEVEMYLEQALIVVSCTQQTHHVNGILRHFSWLPGHEGV